MSAQMLKMLAGMVGMTPEKLEAEVAGFQSIVNEGRASLSRIESNTQENGAMLRALCEKMGVEYVRPVSHGDSDAGTGDAPG